MTKFSIIVPVYNIEQYIDQCVESLVGQSYLHLEIILVNDGSKDSSLEKLSAWVEKDKRVIVIDKPNGGLSSARNAGMDIATGDYISFIDGDDWVDMDLYTNIEKAISTNGNLDMITFSLVKYYNDETQIKLKYTNSTEVFTGEAFFQDTHFYVNACSKVYSKQIIDKYHYRFIEGLLHEDVPFTIPFCLDCKRIVNIDIPSYFYRQEREGSILNSYKEKNLIDTFLIINRLFLLAKDKYNFAYMPLNDRIIKIGNNLILKGQKFGRKKLWSLHRENNIPALICELLKHSSYRNSLYGLLIQINYKLAFDFVHYKGIFKQFIKSLIKK